MGDCRIGIAEAGDALTTVDVDGTEMVAPADLDLAPATGWLALPGFDEFMLGYKDRALMATPEQLAAVVPGGNGVFQSTLIRDGRVAAIWKRTLTARKVTVTVLPQVAPFTAADRRHATEALQPYAEYLGLPMTINFPD